MLDQHHIFYLEVLYASANEKSFNVMNLNIGLVVISLYVIWETTMMTTSFELNVCFFFLVVILQIPMKISMVPLLMWLDVIMWEDLLIIVVLQISMPKMSFIFMIMMIEESLR